MEIKEIRGYEGIYEVDETGTVYKINRRKNGSGFKTVKSQRLLPNGYYAVNLWKNNKREDFYIHRLLAEHFIENPNPKIFDCVNHIDGIKTNNALENLEWCTKTYNTKHAREHGLCHDEKPCIRIEDGKIYKSLSEAAEEIFGSRIREADIGAVCRGKRNKAGGYHWKFI